MVSLYTVGDSIAKWGGRFRARESLDRRRRRRGCHEVGVSQHLWKGEVDGVADQASGEDDQQEAGQEQHGLQDGHALLEDDLVGQEVEAGGQCDDLSLGLLPLRLERDDGRLPDLVVLLPHIVELAQDRLVEVVEERVDAGDLLALHLL